MIVTFELSLILAGRDFFSMTFGSEPYDEDNEIGEEISTYRRGSGPLY
jgi:hypothetical protein